MGTSAGLNLPGLALFVFLIVTQILAISLLPRTAGFTNLGWTLIFLTVMSVSQWSFATVLHRGMPISLVVPIMAALIPLAAIAIGVIFYEEAASFARLGLLAGACGLIGLASALR